MSCCRLVKAISVSPKLRCNIRIVTAKELVAILEQAGWVKDRQSGSHAIFKHPDKPGRLVVPMHSGDVPKGTMRSILKKVWGDK